MRTESGAAGGWLEVTELKKTQNEFLYLFSSLHCTAQGDQTKEDKLAKARSTHERNHLGRHGRGREDSTKWISVEQGGKRRSEFICFKVVEVKVIYEHQNELRIPENQGFFIIFESISF
jgi:hypothetical protein